MKPTFADLKKWLNANGGFAHPGLVRQERDGIWGIFTSQTLREGEVLAEIPPHLVLGPQLYNDRFPLIHERDQTIFALLCETEKGPQSKFYPWIAQLPSLEDFRLYHPLFATEDEIVQLNQLCPRIVQTLLNFKGRIDDFQRLTENRFEFPDTVWASLVYLTRAFAGNGLVPFCDMFNHNSSRGRGLIDNRFLKVGQTLEAMDEVYISYGRHIDSLELWLRFGFIDRAQPAIIGCTGIKLGDGTMPFDQDCYLDHNGPSDRLQKVCASYGGLAPLVNTLAKERGILSATSASPLVQQAQEILSATAPYIKSLHKF